MAGGPVGGGCATSCCWPSSWDSSTYRGSARGSWAAPDRGRPLRPSYAIAAPLAETLLPPRARRLRRPPQATAGSSRAPLPHPRRLLPLPTPPLSEYLAAWQDERWADMYGLLAPSAQATIDQTKFVTRYQNITDAATVTQIKTTMGQPQLGPLPNTARVPSRCRSRPFAWARSPSRTPSPQLRKRPLGCPLDSFPDLQGPPGRQHQSGWCR